MKKLSFKHPVFVKSALKKEDYPPCVDSRGNLLPEFAVIGRSNVGKSSLLNHLFQEKTLLRTSSTPGKTQLLNFFLLDNKLSFVDLPGYGYAKVPGEVKKNWGESIETYLDSRENLQLVLWLLDIRRDLSEEDLQMAKWLYAKRMNVIVVLTKTDLLKPAEVQKQQDALLSSLSSLFFKKDIPIVLFSSLKKIGRDYLITQIEKCLY